MEIKLQKTNIKHLDIEGNAFDIDCNSMAAMKALDEFTKATASLEAIDESLLAISKDCIEVILGKGAYDKLFEGYEGSIAPYYLVLELNRIYQDEFEKDERGRREAEAQANMNQISEMANNVEALAKATDYASAKYGGGNAAAYGRRATGKHRRR